MFDLYREEDEDDPILSSLISELSDVLWWFNVLYILIFFFSPEGAI